MKSFIDESPFLNEALLFAESDAQEWESSFEVLRESPFLVEGETGVIGDDDRVRVTPTTGIPWRWICRIDVKGNRDSQPGGGTGVLVSDRHVLTAAHVIYEAWKNMQNFSIQVTPALDYGTEPFGSYLVSDKPKVPAHYDPDADDHLDWDYALLKLDTAIGRKNFTDAKPLCFWGSPQCNANAAFGRLEPERLLGKSAFTAGYPRSAGARKLMCARGLLHSVKRMWRKMGITADTTKGQSGSPVWIVEDGVYHLVGIAVGASGQTNFAVRVTRELVRQLRTWITADGETPAMTENEAPALDVSSEVEVLETEADEYPEREYPVFEAEYDEPSPEMFAPKVSPADLCSNVNDYFDRAGATYTLPGGNTVRAWPQFRYAKAGGTEEAKVKVGAILGKKFEKDHPRAIHMAAYGRATPSEIAAITQALIDKGEFVTVKADNPGLDDAQLVRKLQRKFKMGIDCAGYVQLAFVFAFMGNDNDTLSVRRNLGLQDRRGDERLSDLPLTHFKKVDIVDAQCGDLFILEPRAGSSDRAWHTVIVFDHSVDTTDPAKPIHSFQVDASWGTDLYTEKFGGVARRTLNFSPASGEWWDTHPDDGSVANKNTIGPYAGHIIHGMFRAKQT